MLQEGNLCHLDRNFRDYLVEPATLRNSRSGKSKNVTLFQLIRVLKISKLHNLERGSESKGEMSFMFSFKDKVWRLVNFSQIKLSGTNPGLISAGRMSFNRETEGAQI
jgi:hypothetical protein